MAHKFLRDFVILLATINPVEALCVFLAVTKGMAPPAARRVALRAVLYAGGVLLGFIVLGQIVLDVMDVSMASFQIAGGIVLFLFGLRMIFEQEPAPGDSAESGHDVAVFPLAMPTIACPGSILAAVLLTDNDQFPPVTQSVTTLILVGILGLTFITLLSAGRIFRVLGNSGSAILIRVMGLMLASLAVEEIFKGLALAGVRMVN
jgi:multiple antibiotic resistance protein